MAKIAAKADSIARLSGPEQAAGALSGRPLVDGQGWSVREVLCTAGPKDRPFEEQHSSPGIAIVTAGTFQYRSSAGRELMTPGSLMLGNSGQFYECSHEHGIADRCISFSYDAKYFDGLAEEAGACSANFSALRIPLVRDMSTAVARASAAAMRRAASNYSSGTPHDWQLWEEIAIVLAIQALQFKGQTSTVASLASEARVTRIVRMIEGCPTKQHKLVELAQEARLSRYHFIRMFQQLTGLTPHQYVLRTRLRRAATQMLIEPARVLDIALDCGFGDISNFNHAFLAEFGTSPRSYRTTSR